VSLVALAPRAWAQSPQPFSDVSPRYWAYQAILDLRGAGIIKGLPGNRFEPNAPVTRAQFVKMIVLALGIPLPNSLPSDPFPDVKKTSWVAPYAQAAVQKGIVQLGPGRPFEPNAPITRQDIAAMVGRSEDLGAMAQSAPDASYTDSSTIAVWAQGYVSVAQQLGWMKGMPSGAFKPLSDATKGQAAALVDAVRMTTSAALASKLNALAQNLTLKIPSAALQVGQSETLHATVTGPSGEVLPVTPTFTAAGGTVTSTGVFTATAAGTAVITATLGSLTATAQVTVTNPGPSLTPIEGKGIWLMNADVTKTYTPQQIVATAVQDGIHTLYLEVGSTYNNQGFWGQEALGTLLPLAHQNGIAVMGWIFDTLQNPAADLQLAQEAATYNVQGQTVDGLALDLEGNATMNPSVVGPFDAQLRAELGPGTLLVAVTYPPQSLAWPGTTSAAKQASASAVFTLMAQTYDAVAPMDYWHHVDTTYTAAQARSYVQTSIIDLHQWSGDPAWPVAVIGQTYNMFTDSNGIPSPQEVEGAMGGAEVEGAIGFSVYRWATATADEQSAFVAMPFVPTLPSIDGGRS